MQRRPGRAAPRGSGDGEDEGDHDEGPAPAPIPAPAPAHAAPVHPAPKQVAGYRILEPLGRGSMGSVYKAVQVSLDRVVAIKILHPHSAQNPRHARRFEREAVASAKMNHPHIIGALDVGEEGGMRYIVMEYIEGKSVAQLLAAGPMDPHRAVGIVVQIARALDYAHRAEIVHRDIKPANILVTKEGVAKLCDLGLAKEVAADSSGTEEGLAMGTPFYLSPEQARGERRIDIRTDIYALGATLFHMVTGRVPYPGANPAVVMTRHLNDPLEPPDEVNPSVGRGISQIIEKMMAKEREARYQTPAELLLDLQAWMEGRLEVHQAIQIRSRRRFRRFR